MEEILDTITKAIIKINQDKAILSDKIEKLNSEHIENKKKVQNDGIALDIIDIINKNHKSQLDALNAKIDFLTSTIKDEVAKIDIKNLFAHDIKKLVDLIPIPKDGKSATVDYSLVNKFILDKINAIEIPKNEEIDYDKISNLVQAEFKKLPIPKDGTDGINGAGKDGLNGVGIADIKDKPNEFIITLTDGKEYKIKKPKPTSMIYSGGGSSNSGGFDIQNLPTFTELQSNDFVLIERDGVLGKISASLIGVAPTNGVTYNGVIVMYNNDIITYE
jgi:hypothetical protein